MPRTIIYDKPSVMVLTIINVTKWIFLVNLEENVSNAFSRPTKHMWTVGLILFLGVQGALLSAVNSLYAV